MSRGRSAAMALSALHFIRVTAKGDTATLTSSLTLTNGVTSSLITHSKTFAFIGLASHSLVQPQMRLEGKKLWQLHCSSFGLFSYFEVLK